MEYLDIVNLQDEVIGQAPRPAIHQQGLCHRAAHLFIHDQNHVLLQRRHANKQQFPNCWDASVSGHVLAGEDYLACIIREAEEELGINVQAQQLKHCGKLAPNNNNGQEFVSVFACQHQGPFTIQTDDIALVQWLPPNTINNMLADQPETFVGNFATVFKTLLQHTLLEQR